MTTTVMRKGSWKFYLGGFQPMFFGSAELAIFVFAERGMLNTIHISDPGRSSNYRIELQSGRPRYYTERCIPDYSGMWLYNQEPDSRGPMAPEEQQRMVFLLRQARKSEEFPLWAGLLWTEIMALATKSETSSYA